VYRYLTRGVGLTATDFAALKQKLHEA